MNQNRDKKIEEQNRFTDNKYSTEERSHISICLIHLRIQAGITQEKQRVADEGFAQTTIFWHLQPKNEEKSRAESDEIDNYKTKKWNKFNYASFDGSQ